MMIRTLLPLALLLLAAATGDPALAAAPGYDDCVKGGWPAFEDAETRAAACSKALQSRQLKPEEIALARLTRGVARLAMGEKVLAADDYSEALKHYDSAIDWSRPDALAVYRHAVSLEGLGEIDRALKDYAEAIRLDPGSWLAFLGRGVLLATRQRAYRRAIEDFDKVLAIDSRNVAALMARGSARSQLNQHGPALADLEQAVALAPGDAQAHLVRGLARWRHGDNELALQDYDLILQGMPDHPMALTNRAAIYILQGKLDPAIRDLEAAIAVNSDNPLALFNVGYARFLKGDYAKAISDYGFAIALDPRMGDAYANRCLTRAVAGKDVLRALDDCDAALKLLPISAEARETRGTVFLKLGDPQLAIHEYDIALASDANRPMALYGRGAARLAAGQARNGAADRAAALALDPRVAGQFERYGIK
jgi:tetratricopeptide (TPR) repeat protein